MVTEVRVSVWMGQPHRTVTGNMHAGKYAHAETRRQHTHSRQPQVGRMHRSHDQSINQARSPCSDTLVALKGTSTRDVPTSSHLVPLDGTSLQLAVVQVPPRQQK